VEAGAAAGEMAAALTAYLQAGPHISVNKCVNV